jgi:predicted DNA-binding antitoxin AbrB/MazE fold protein
LQNAVLSRGKNAMYQAIEAISRAGVIQPLEPISFDENEHLVILRISKSGLARPPASVQGADWTQWVGALKNSPNLNGDPVSIQHSIRHEWD